jgi:putative spermidine/putrescine transport system permease protein
MQQRFSSHIAVTLLLSVGVLPLLGGLLYAFAYSVGWVGALSTGANLNAWTTVLSDVQLWRSLGLSLLIAVLVVLLSSGVALCLLLSLRPLLARRWVRFALHLPLALPPMVAAMISFQWLRDSGMLVRIATALGWVSSSSEAPHLINDAYYIGVVLTLTLMTFPVLLLVLLNHYQQAGLEQMSRLAATLGASGAATAWRVVIPVLLQRAKPTFFLYAVLLFGAFEVPLLLGRQNPAMISMFIHQKFNRFNLADLPVAYAATVVYAVLIMAVLALVKINKKNYA